MGNPPRVVLKDVAERAGVSTTTVSHVLNEADGKRIAEDTRARVRAAAAELGYRPNAVARSLRTRRTGVLAFVSDEIATTPHAGRIILGAQEAASERGRLLMLVNTGGDRATEDAEVAALQASRVDGFIYATMYHREVELSDVLRSEPAVLLDARTMDQQTPSVVPDEFAGACTATQVLLDHGHRRIGFATNVHDIPATRGRLAGYRQALSDTGVTPEDELVVAEISETEGGLRAGRTLLDLDPRPTAIFCFNDRMAMGVYHAAAERRLRIPEDLSVVGFDNQELIADGLRPGLTTMALPHYEMGAWAVETLIRRLEHPESGSEQVMLPCPLVSRDSVAAPPPG